MLDPCEIIIRQAAAIHRRKRRDGRKRWGKFIARLLATRAAPAARILYPPTKAAR